MPKKAMAARSGFGVVVPDRPIQAVSGRTTNSTSNAVIAAVDSVTREPLTAEHAVVRLGDRDEQPIAA